MQQPAQRRLCAQVALDGQPQIRAVIQQKLRHVEGLRVTQRRRVAGAEHVDQRRIALDQGFGLVVFLQPQVGGQVFGRAARQQKRYHAQRGIVFEKIQVDSVVQGGELPAFVALVDVGSMRQQQIDDVLAPVHHGDVQRRSARLPERRPDKAAGAGERRIFGQQPPDLGRIARDGGLKKLNNPVREVVAARGAQAGQVIGHDGNHPRFQLLAGGVQASFDRA